MTSTTAGLSATDRLARRNALFLAGAQAMYGVTTSTVITLGGIVGSGLGPDKSYATLPVTTMMLGTMLATVPSSLFMARFGRRLGFSIGCTIGAVAGLLAAYAIVTGSFLLFCLATHFVGYYQSTAQFYRFAASDVATPAYRPRAISWALGGGLLGALLAPEIIRPTKDLMVLNAACFIAAAAMALVGLLLVQFIRIPVPARAADGGTGRPLFDIVLKPKFLAALAAGAVSYGMMVLVMTATPLAMQACGLSIDASAEAIRWHVVAMYLPSFFAGALIARFGRERIAFVGLALLLVCGGIALAGIDLANFVAAMVALGVGWNLSYVSATALVADSHTPEERGKVQAFNDLTIFAFVALCSFLSGTLLARIGWEGVNIAIFPIVALAVVLIVALPFLGKSRSQTAGT